MLAQLVEYNSHRAVTVINKFLCGYRVARDCSDSLQNTGEMLLLFIKHCCCTAKGTNGNCECLDSMWTYKKPTKNHSATQCIGTRGRKYIQVSIWSRVIKCSSVRWWSSNQLNMLQTEATQNTRTLNQQPVEHITVALLPKQITIHIYMEVWWSQWVMRWWWRYLSAARCRLFTNGPADATATKNLIISCLI